MRLIPVTIQSIAEATQETTDLSSNIVDSIDNVSGNADEIADIASYVFLLSDDLGLDLFAEIERKMAKNGAKYPVDKCFGKATKYNELK